jgi:hypothetical protein
MCDAAKQIIDKCKPVVTIGTMKIKLQSSMCKMGLTAFGGYPIESCIQKSAGNCDAINKCFSNAFGGTSSSPAMRKRMISSIFICDTWTKIN